MGIVRKQGGDGGEVTSGGNSNENAGTSARNALSVCDLNREGSSAQAGKKARDQPQSSQAHSLWPL